MVWAPSLGLGTSHPFTGLPEGGCCGASCSHCGLNLCPPIYHNAQVLVIHLGDNDLAQRTSLSLTVQAKQDMHHIRSIAPGIVILWSDIIPVSLEGGAEPSQD